MRGALHLQEQLDAARVNAILVVIQLGYDNASSDPGALLNSGAFQALLSELLTERLDPLLGSNLDVQDLDRVVLGAFSGGYTAAAAIAQMGGVDLHEIDLYDSLFANVASFQDWIQTNIGSFDGTPEGRRFVDVYSASGGTLDNSQALAAQVSLQMTDAGLAAQLDDSGTDPFEALAHAVIFRYADVSHIEVPRSYFGILAKASGFAALR